MKCFYNTLGLKDNMLSSLKKKNQSGRSMVEILGVLSMIAILSVAGIAGYAITMRSHRANEVVNSILKLYTVGIAQNSGEGNVQMFYSKHFGTLPAGTDEIIYNDDKTVVAFIKEEDLCLAVKNKLGSKIKINECSGDPRALVVSFEDMLSAESAIDTSINNEGDCVAADKTWCSGINGNGACSNVTDCCVSVSVPLCKKCIPTTGEVVDKIMGDVCDTNGDGTNDGSCAPLTMTGATCNPDNGNDDCGSDQECVLGYCAKPSETVQCLPVSCTQIDSCCITHNQDYLLSLAQDLIEAGKWNELVTFADQANIQQCTECYGDNVVQNKPDGERCSVVEIDTTTGNINGLQNFNEGICVNGSCRKDLCNNKNLGPCQKCHPMTGEVMSKIYGDTCDADGDGENEGSCAPYTMTGTTCNPANGDEDCDSGQKCILGYCVQPVETMQCLPVNCSYLDSCCMNFDSNNLLQQAQELLSAGKYSELGPYADQANTLQCSECDPSDGTITPKENGTSCSFVEVNSQTGEVKGIDTFNVGECHAGRCMGKNLEDDGCQDGYVKGMKIDRWGNTIGTIKCMSCPTNGQSFYAYTEDSCLKCPGYVYDSLTQLCNPRTCNGIRRNYYSGGWQETPVYMCYPCDMEGVVDIGYHYTGPEDCMANCPDRIFTTDADDEGYCEFKTDYEDLDMCSVLYPFTTMNGEKIDAQTCTQRCPNREWPDYRGCSLKECPAGTLKTSDWYYTCVSCDAQEDIGLPGELSESERKSLCENTCPNREYVDYHCQLKTCPSGTIRQYGYCKSCDSEEGFSLDYNLSESERKSLCENTCPNREYKNYRCQLKTCPSGTIRTNDGSCGSCDYEGYYSDSDSHICSQCPNRELITREDDQVLCVLKCTEGMTHSDWGDCVPCASTDYFTPLSDSSCVSDCQSTPYPRMVIEHDSWSSCVRRNCPSGSVLTSDGQCVSCDLNDSVELYNPNECETTCRGKRRSYTDGNDYTTCRKICGNNQFYQYGSCTNCDSLYAESDDVNDCTQKCPNRYHYSFTFNGSNYQTNYQGCALNTCPTGYFRDGWHGSCYSCERGGEGSGYFVTSKSECDKCANDGAHARTYRASSYSNGGYCDY